MEGLTRGGLQGGLNMRKVSLRRAYPSLSSSHICAARTRYTACKQFSNLNDTESLCSHTYEPATHGDNASFPHRTHGDLLFVFHRFVDPRSRAADSFFVGSSFMGCGFPIRRFLVRDSSLVSSSFVSSWNGLRIPRSGVSCLLFWLFVGFLAEYQVWKLVGR